MSKKILFIILIVVLALFSACLIWKYVINELAVKNIEKENKEVVVNSLIEDVIFFDVPQDWNIFFNGNPILVTDIAIPGGRESIVTSVSSGGSPITYSDMNWRQADLLITDGNMITDDFVSKQNNVEQQQYQNFSGYMVSDFDDSKSVSKVNSDGAVYYLSPNKESVNWNLIIRTQTSGDDEFQEGISLLLNSLRFQDHDEYINELNK